MKIELVARYNDNPIEAKGTLGAMASLVAGEPVAVDLEAKAGGANLRLLGDLGKPGVEKGTNLVVSAEGSQLGELSQLAGDADPGARALQGQLAPAGDQGRVTRPMRSRRWSAPDAIMLASATGSVANLAAAEGINLQVELKGPSLAALNEPAKLNLPPIGPYEIGAAVSGQPPGDPAEGPRRDGRAAATSPASAALALAAPRPVDRRDADLQQAGAGRLHRRRLRRRGGQRGPVAAVRRAGVPGRSPAAGRAQGRRSRPCGSPAAAWFWKR